MSMETGAANPLDFLFKLSTQRKLPAPVFCQVVEDGPPHMKTFVWKCSFMTMTAEGTGRSKKEAKTAAAQVIKDSITPESLPPEVPNKKRKNEKVQPNSREGNERKRKKGSLKKQQMGFFPPPMGGGGSGPMSYGPPGFKGKMTLDDHYVITKHKNIYPKEDELDGILKLVTKLEEGLRSVSDELAEAKRGDKEEEEDKEKHRDIMGVARVGDLAKGLILSSDVVVDIVIMCKEVPLVSDLKRVLELLRPKLEDYELTERLEEAGFHVSSPPLLARVCLTSSKVKEEGAFEGLEDPLSKEKTLEALTELKRSNWFGSMAVGLPSCVECIRIIKEMTRRDPSWACLSNWLTELLVERSLFSAHAPLSPSSSLLRVLEVISSGIFLEGGSGLKDPCENEDQDVSSYLTPQQREDLTHSAQYFIRLITYRQINKVLGMDKLPPRNKGGKRNGADKALVTEEAPNNNSSTPNTPQESSTAAS
eukprot:TRINITY_DN1076_c0_g1_i1.p1 TRINITY_DN1076_c0_g1~~TRINITY_DN1076_c0_g1_i1.p1  ORF type:complete len:478 (+),score=209.00 TRINITY_DN1076_c0_g1_i1:160-1593(+)